MTYATMSVIQRDADIRDRVSACVATELPGIYPEQWASDHAWELVKQPDWCTRWEAAVQAHINEPNYRPGWDDAVITDDMILAGVQAIQSAST